MKKLLLFLITTVFLFNVNIYSQTKEDTLGIQQAAMDYFEGWYERDTIRLTRGLHDELCKRCIRTNKETGEEYLSSGTKQKLIRYARKKGPSGIPKEDLKIDFTIYNINGDIASILVVSKDYYDYAHLARINDEWKIINVLWTKQSK